MKDSLENTFTTSKGQPNLPRTDNGKEFVSKVFFAFLSRSYAKKYSRYTSVGAVPAERFNLSVMDFLKEPVFETKKGKWFSGTRKNKTIQEQKICFHQIITNSTSFENNEAFENQSLLNRRKKVRPN